MSFTAAARIRRQTVGVIACGQGTGNPKFLDLPNLGYVDKISIATALTQQFGVADATAADAFAARQAALDRITLRVNGIGELFDCDGDMAAIISALQEAYDTGSAKVQGTPAAFVAPATAGHAAPFTNKWHHQIPLGIQLQGFEAPVGMFQTALQNLSVRLELRWLPLRATAATPGTGQYVPAGGTTTVADESGNAQLLYKYFDPIQSQADQPYLGLIHKWTQWSVPIVGPGDLQIPLPGQNYYTRILYRVVSGGAGALALDSSNLTRLRLSYGGNFAFFDEDESHGEVSARMRRDYGILFDSWPAAYYTHDMVHTTHNNRDWVNAGATTNLRAILTFGAGITGGGGSQVTVCAEEIAPLVLPQGLSVQGSARAA